MFNTDQSAAHRAAFDASADPAMMAAHLRADHGMPTALAVDLPRVLRLLHAGSHDNEDADPNVHAHAAGPHTCHAAPLCSYWTDGSPEWACGHASCNEIVHELCEACYAESMTGTDHFDPILCERHGWTHVEDAGSNSGFAGEGVWWESWGCGCGTVEQGAYDGR